MNPLVSDFRTIQDAAAFKKVSYFTLLSWMARNGVKTSKVGNLRVVRLSDLESYIPRKERKAVAR